MAYSSVTMLKITEYTLYKSILCHMNYISVKLLLKKKKLIKNAHKTKNYDKHELISDLRVIQSKILFCFRQVRCGRYYKAEKELHIIQRITIAQKI